MIDGSEVSSGHRPSYGQANSQHCGELSSPKHRLVMLPDNEVVDTCQRLDLGCCQVRLWMSAWGNRVLVMQRLKRVQSSRSSLSCSLRAMAADHI